MPLQPVSSVYPGLILEQDVIADNGRFLASRGQSLTRDKINALLIWGVDKVDVRDGFLPAGHEVQESLPTSLPEFSVQELGSLPSELMQRSLNQELSLCSLATKLIPDPGEQDLQARIRYLEKSREFALLALNKVAELSDFYSSLSRQDETRKILQEASRRLKGLIDFRASCFFCMDEAHSTFKPALCQPESRLREFALTMEALAHRGHMATIIRNQRPVMLTMSADGEWWLAHILSTASRVRGLFLGVIQDCEQTIPAEAMALLNIILQNAANALESNELYSLFSRQNQELQARVEERTRKLQETVNTLENEVQQRKAAQENLSFIFNNVNDAILVFSSQGRILDLNQKMLSMFGVSREKARELRIPMDISCQRRSTDHYFETWNQVFEQGSILFEWTVRSLQEDRTFPVEVFLKRITWDGSPAVLATMRDISQRKEAEKKLEFLALHDPLTELPNRKLFTEQVGQAIVQARRGEMMAAVLYIDLDGFKPINDSLGHAAGDSVLKTVAQRLRNELRKTDTVARLGGDEFGVVIPDLYLDTDYLRVAEKVQTSVARPMDISGRSLQLGCSIGVAVFPQDGQDVDTLLNVADTEMYKQKSTKQKQR